MAKTRTLRYPCGCEAITTFLWRRKPKINLIPCAEDADWVEGR